VEAIKGEGKLCHMGSLDLKKRCVHGGGTHKKGLPQKFFVKKGKEEVRGTQILGKGLKMHQKLLVARKKGSVHKIPWD